MRKTKVFLTKGGRLVTAEVDVSRTNSYRGVKLPRAKSYRGVGLSRSDSLFGLFVQRFRLRQHAVEANVKVMPFETSRQGGDSKTIIYDESCS